VVEMVDIPKIQTNLFEFSNVKQNERKLREMGFDPEDSVTVEEWDEAVKEKESQQSKAKPVAVKIPSVAPTVRGVANREKKSLWVDNYPPEFHEYLKTMKRYPENLHTKSFAPNYNLWNQFVSQHENPLSMIAAKKAMDEGEPEPEPEPEPEGTHEDRVREMMGY